MKSQSLKLFGSTALYGGLLLLFSCMSLGASAHVEAFADPVLKVTGTVVDGETREPIIGANITVVGSQTGTTTDLDGRYSIDVEPDASLEITYTGYARQVINVNGQSVIDIELSVNKELLDEVVVVGYGKKKKSHLTGSVSKVTNEKLDQIPTARVDDALNGQVAGVQIQSTNPAAGEAPVIRIRGQGSISFDSNPLVVVDGVAVGNDADFLSSIDMNDVQSVEILKDAASTAIYGSRGANGIIMITTKDGVEGPTQFSYNSYIGNKEVFDNDVLTTVDDWIAQARAASPDGEISDKLKYIEMIGQNTDWQDVMFDGGTIQSHALSARGGTKNTKFRASLSYLDDEGVLLTDNFEKINFRLNLDTRASDRVSFGIMLNPSYTKQRRFPIGVHDAIRQQPWLPLYLTEDNIQFVNRFRENGRWADAQIGDYAMERMFDDYDLDAMEPSMGSGTDISGTSNQSALAKVLERERYRYQTKVFANTYMNVDLAKGLSFRQTVGGDFRYTRNTRWQGIQASRNGAADSESIRTTATQFHTVAESTLRFDREFGKHEFDAVAGFAYESWDRESSVLEAAGYDFDFIQTIPAANLVGGSTFEAQEALISYLSRVNYAYDDKYLLSLSARYDGSSKFGTDNKFGFFPAVAAGWRISQEGFLKDNALIDELKIRASYGLSGSNAGIGEYDYIGLIEPVGTALGGNNTGFNAINISNSTLQWEKLREFNPGIDVSLLSGQFTFSVDYYDRTSEDLLLDLPIPAVTGFSSALVNRGVVRNSGVEIEATTRNITTPKFQWSTNILVTHNKNELVDFAGSSGLISIVDSKRPAEWIAMEGQPIASFYGYVVSQEIAPEFIKNPTFPINAQSQDIYVKDINGDGVIDTDDRTILGSPYPDFVWSVNNQFRFMDFDFNFMFQGSHGAEVRNISSQYIKNEFSSNQDYTADFPDADQVVQRIFTNDDIQDASYVALRNVNLGYTFRGGFFDRANVRNLRVYASAQNLLYFWSNDYEGWNPEGIDQGLGSPLTYGYQRGPAPLFRSVSFGVNLNF